MKKISNYSFTCHKRYRSIKSCIQIIWKIGFLVVIKRKQLQLKLLKLWCKFKDWWKSSSSLKLTLIWHLKIYLSTLTAWMSKLEIMVSPCLKSIAISFITTSFSINGVLQKFGRSSIKKVKMLRVYRIQTLILLNVSLIIKQLMFIHLGLFCGRLRLSMFHSKMKHKVQLLLCF